MANIRELNTPHVILFLSANPSDTARLRVEREYRGIETQLERAQHRSSFRLHCHSAATPDSIQHAFRKHKPTIVHFSGHGEGERGLLFEDRNGNAQLVTTSALVALFELFAGKICCVVLNACYAEVQAKAISAHVPYVIGMSEAISDQAAVEFAAAFYDALGSGQKIELAFKAACVQLQLLNIPEDQIPVLKRGMPPLPPPSEPIQHPLPEGSLDPHLVVIPAGILSIEQSGVSIPIKKFAMGRYLITFEEFDKFCVLCNKDKPSDQGSGRGKQPVVNVSCQSAREYCEWLSFQTGKHYRLPTSEEWLYVAKEGFRDLSRPRSNLNNYIWHRHNSGNKPHPVGKNKPNRLGVYDVLGNIWEWVALPHSDSREIASGGCYRMDLNNLIKYPQQNADAGHLIGFRVVVELG